MHVESAAPPKSQCAPWGARPRLLLLDPLLSTDVSLVAVELAALPREPPHALTAIASATMTEMLARRSTRTMEPPSFPRGMRGVAGAHFKFRACAKLDESCE